MSNQNPHKNEDLWTLYRAGRKHPIACIEVLPRTILDVIQIPCSRKGSFVWGSEFVDSIRMEKHFLWSPHHKMMIAVTGLASLEREQTLTFQAVWNHAKDQGVWYNETELPSICKGFILTDLEKKIYPDFDDPEDMLAWMEQELDKEADLFGCRDPRS